MNEKISPSLTPVAFSFSDHTTYGLGGSALGAFFPESEEELYKIYDELKSSGEKFIILGNGSNVLASDKGFDGYVISTKHLSGIRRTSNGYFCLAGTTVKYILNYCIMHGVGGVEYLSGIPATAGGLAYMNGGAHKKYVSDNIASVRFYDGKITELSQKECNFGYKHSTMRDVNGAISGITLDLQPQKAAITRQKIGAYLSERAMQPAGKSCGCVFKNPEGLSAGKLIEEAGLKGKMQGGAKVSEKHANFIICDGGSASDVYRLIDIVKSRVRAFCGVELEEEVVYIGEF